MPESASSICLRRVMFSAKMRIPPPKCRRGSSKDEPPSVPNECRLAHPNGLRQLAGFLLEGRGGEPLSNARACLEKSHSGNALVSALCQVSNQYTTGH